MPDYAPELVWEPSDHTQAIWQVCQYLVSKGALLANQTNWQQANEGVIPGFSVNTEQNTFYLTKRRPWLYELKVHTSRENSFWTKAYEITDNELKDISAGYTWRSTQILPTIENIWNSRFPAEPFDAFDL